MYPSCPFMRPLCSHNTVLYGIHSSCRCTLTGLYVCCLSAFPHPFFRLNHSIADIKTDVSLSAARHTHRAQHAGPNIFRPGGRTGSPGEMRSMIWLNKELSKTDTPVPGGWCDINHRRNSTPDWVRRPASHSLSYRNTGSSAEMITTGLLNTGVLWSWIYPSFSSPGPAGLYRNYILNYFLTKHLFCKQNVHHLFMNSRTWIFRCI